MHWLAAGMIHSFCVALRSTCMGGTLKFRCQTAIALHLTSRLVATVILIGATSARRLIFVSARHDFVCHLSNSDVFFKTNRRASRAWRECKG